MLAAVNLLFRRKYSYKQGDHIMKYTLSFLVGTVFGAVIALLYAPFSGDELRKNIKNQAESEYAKLQDEWQKGMQELHTRMDKMSSDLQAMSKPSKGTGEPA